MGWVWYGMGWYSMGWYLMGQREQKQQDPRDGDAFSLMKYLCRAPVDIINSFRTFEFTNGAGEPKRAKKGAKMD